MNQRACGTQDFGLRRGDRAVGGHRDDHRLHQRLLWLWVPGRRDPPTLGRVSAARSPGEVGQPPLRDTAGPVRSGRRGAPRPGRRRHHRKCRQQGRDGRSDPVEVSRYRPCCADAGQPRHASRPTPALSRSTRTSTPTRRRWRVPRAPRSVPPDWPPDEPRAAGWPARSAAAAHRQATPPSCRRARRQPGPARRPAASAPTRAGAHARDHRPGQAAEPPRQPGGTWLGGHLAHPAEVWRAGRRRVPDRPD